MLLEKKKSHKQLDRLRFFIMSVIRTAAAAAAAAIKRTLYESFKDFQKNL